VKLDDKTVASLRWTDEKLKKNSSAQGNARGTFDIRSLKIMLDW
jgi:hypothetical protein